MNGPTRALIWQSWRLSRPELWIWLYSLIFLSVLFWSLSSVMDDFQREAVATAFAMVLMAVSVVSFAWTDGMNGSQTFIFSANFTMPVSTRRLVLAPLITIIIKSCLTFIVSIWVLRGVSGIEIPVAGATLIVALLTSVLIAVSWSATSLKTRSLLTLGIFVLAFVVMLRFIMTDAVPHNPLGQKVWPQAVSLLSLLVGAGVIVSASVAVWGVNRQRHRAELAPAERIVSLSELKGKPARLANRFGNTLQALVWYETRKIGIKPFVWQLAVCLLCGALVGFLILGTGANREILLVPYSVVVTGFALLIHGILGTVQGINFNHRGADRFLHPFETFRPVSNERLVFAKLLSVMGNMGLGMLIAWLFLAAYWGWVDQGPAGASTLRSMSDAWLELLQPRFVLLLLIAVVGCSVLSLAFFLYVSRYPKSALTMFVMGVVLIGLAGWDAERGWQYRQYWNWLVPLVAVVLGAISTWFAWKSVASKSIDRRLIALIVGVWGVILAYLEFAGHPVLPKGLSSVSNFPWIPVVTATWIPAALAISLPWIIAPLRHR